MPELKKFANFMASALIISVILVSCNEKSFNPEDPADVFAAAVKPYNDGLYDIALQKLGQFKSRFPYSAYSAKADLYTANAHFELANYQEAAVAYSQFIKLHPRHENIDFARFRIGQSYWVEAPEEVDREQDFTARAIQEWQNLLTLHPRSKYAKEAKEKIYLGQKRIAKSNEFIMNFYCKQEKYHACAFKAISILDNYKEFPKVRQAALKKAALAFDKLAEQKAKDPDDDSNIYFKSMTSKGLKQKAEIFRRAIKP